MRKILFFTTIFLTVFSSRMNAQLPITSTADNPVWYYIQVIGKNDSRENRVLTVTGNYLYGKILSKTNDAQLFRFEKNGNNYQFISKSTNKKVNVGIKDGGEILTIKETGIDFRLETASRFYYNIITTKTPDGGDSNKIYTYLANLENSYRVTLVDNTLSTEENALYSFVPYNTVNLKYSTSDENFYYYIMSSKEAQERYLTDISATGNYALNFSLEDYSESSDNQLWKVIKKGVGNEVEFMNKATGNLIRTKSEATGLYNKIQFTTNMEQSNGWLMTYVNPGQYTVSGIEEDNIRRYWSFTDINELPRKYKNENLPFSDFAWKFRLINENPTGITTATLSDDEIKVYQVNGRIIVEGYNDDYIVRTILGQQVNKYNPLPAGIYLVTVGKKTVKILVK